LQLQTMYAGRANSPSTVLTQPINAQATHLPVLDASVLPDAPNLAVIGTEEDAETVLYNVKGDGFLSGVVRGVEGEARDWEANESIARNFTNLDYRRLTENLSLLAGVSENATKTEVNGANHLLIDGVEKKIDAATLNGKQADSLLQKRETDLLDWMGPEYCAGFKAYSNYELTLRYAKDDMGIVYMHGFFVPSTVFTPMKACFKIPDGFRPEMGLCVIGQASMGDIYTIYLTPDSDTISINTGPQWRSDWILVNCAFKAGA